MASALSEIYTPIRPRGITQLEGGDDPSVSSDLEKPGRVESLGIQRLEHGGAMCGGERRGWGVTRAGIHRPLYLSELAVDQCLHSLGRARDKCRRVARANARRMTPKISIERDSVIG